MRARKQGAPPEPFGTVLPGPDLTTALPDTLLSTYSVLEGFQADVSERAVTPLEIIVSFDVYKYSHPLLVTRPESFSVNALNP
jgi:hypothetical protein